MVKNRDKGMDGFYRILYLKPLRRTEGVCFDYLSIGDVGAVSALDRVIHAGGAVSPGPVEGVQRPWYMHTHQMDNLVVLHGARHVDLYTPQRGVVEHFTVRPNLILRGDEVLADQPAMLCWPRGVFHRVVSSSTEGSASLNLAIHYEGFDPRTNFSIYDLDTESGESRVIREGHEDQPS